MAMVSLNRSKQKPMEALKGLQAQHGLNVQADDSGVFKGESLAISSGRISLAGSGSCAFSELVFDREKVNISSLKLKVFQENPWQWLFDFCGKGLQPTIKISQCEVTVSDGRVFDLGAFEISRVEGSLKGQCKAFFVQQTSAENYSVKGNLSGFIKGFGIEKNLGFVSFKTADIGKETNGIGEATLEIQKIDSLFTSINNPFIVNAIWRSGEVVALHQLDGFGCELKLSNAGETLRLFYKASGVDWNGLIGQGVEYYQVSLGADKSLDLLLKQGSFSKQYKLPEDWQNKLGGIYECKRDLRTHRLQILLVSENKMLTLDEVKE